MFYPSLNVRLSVRLPLVCVEIVSKFSSKLLWALLFSALVFSRKASKPVDPEQNPKFSPPKKPFLRHITT